MAIFASDRNKERKQKGLKKKPAGLIKQTKSAQLSLFIMIGLVLLVFMSFFIALSSTLEKEPEKDLTAESSSLKSQTQLFVEACLKASAVEGLKKIALQGFYYKLPKEHFSYSGVNTSYYYLLGTTRHMPSYSYALKSLKAYLKDNLGACLNTGAANETINIEDISIYYTDNGLEISLNTTLSLSKGKLRTKAENFKAFVYFDPRELMDIATMLITRAVIDPNYIYATDIIEIEQSYGVNISYLTGTNGSYAYYVQYNKSGISLNYWFAVKINTSNNAPELELPDKLYAKAGQYFNYTVSAYDKDRDWLEFYDDTELFDIGIFSGEISFLPIEKGSYNITITVSDGKLNVSKKTLLVVE